LIRQCGQRIKAAMNILVIGAGGREHALAWKCRQSALVDEVWCAPGNPGMDAVGPCFDVAATDLDAQERLALQLEPDLIVIGPEAPLSLGLADRLRARGFDVFGPSAAAARLESSKAFAKARMAAYGIPTARFAHVSDIHAAHAFLDTLSAPYVLKADGLASGKGVIIAATRTEADAAVADMLGGRFGAASASLVIEEFMPGEEASVFALTDGQEFILLPAVQDHKRLRDGDLGPNTGGMGAYAPAPVMTPALIQETARTVIAPLLKGMARDGMPYQGVLYVGLMIGPSGPRVVEFNARFGDPEAQVLMQGLAGDIVPLLLVCATGGLTARMTELLALDRFQPSVGVVMAAPGYPDTPEPGIALSIPHDLAHGHTHGDALNVFHAGTMADPDGTLRSAGGRVLTVTASAPTLPEAVARAYAGVDTITFPGAQIRRDIAARALNREP
jgi:phosphoribosylamine--glycine ligase